MRAVDRWAERREGTRPFFVFVNVIDVHAPYRPRAHCAIPNRLRGVPQASTRRVCATAADRADLPTLRALYDCEIRQVDGKLSRIVDRLTALARDGAPLISFVTSDHGEHFGEHDLLSHQFSLHEALLHIPLIVHGHPDASPARIGAPVSLVDLHATIADWAGLEATVTNDGRPLPLAEDDRARAPVLAHFGDPERLATPTNLGRGLIAQTEALRRGCPDDAPVTGDIHSAIDPPFQLLAYERHPTALFDLREAPAARTNRSRGEPGRVIALSRALAAVTPAAEIPSDAPAREADPETLDALRALGYVAEPE